MSATGFRSFWQRARSHFLSRTEVRDAALAFGSVYLFTDYICGFTVCVGPSMIPTIDPKGEFTFIDRLSYKIAKREYKVNDVVISVSMDDPKKTVCKRIRAVAGDVVYYRNKAGAPVIVKIPDGHVWLLGDNPANSNDSRYYGAVPLGLLQGRVFAKVGLRPVFHISDIDTIFELEDVSGANKVEVKMEVEQTEAKVVKIAKDITTEETTGNGEPKAV